jgi:lysozyme
MTVAQINKAGLELIKSFEGFRERAYRDVGGVWTIAYGHSGDVEPLEVVTEVEGEALLVGDLREHEAIVEKANEVELNPNQFSALVSFEFNTGALPGSTLLRLVNARDFPGAAAQFDRWVHVDGVLVDGLVRRRAAEKALFLSEAIA